MRNNTEGPGRGALDVLSVPGLEYRRDFLSAVQESQLIRDIEGIPETAWERMVMRGRASSRRVCCFGRRYLAQTHALASAPDAPLFLRQLRDQCAEAAAIPGVLLEQMILSHYPPGPGIGAHVDAAVFGEPIIGVSLASGCVMEFENDALGRAKLRLEPRSLFVLRGEARWQWRHRIRTVLAERYSVTLRALVSTRSL